MKTNLVLVLACIFVTSVSGTAQNPPAQAGKAAISGIVRDGTSGEPVSGAVVRLIRLESSGPDVPPDSLTDSHGRFVFANLRAGRFTVSAEKPSYIRSSYGQTGAGVAKSIQLDADTWFRAADINLQPTRSIRGRVVDEAGQGVAAMVVRAVRWVPVGKEELPFVASEARTDIAGNFTVGGLWPGNYSVMTVHPSASVPGDATDSEVEGQTDEQHKRQLLLGIGSKRVALPVGGTKAVIGDFPLPEQQSGSLKRVYSNAFYPSVQTLRESLRLNLRDGNVDGISVLTTSAAGRRICGHVIGSDSTVKGLLLRLSGDDSSRLGRSGDTATSVVSADGSYCFAGVPSGTYFVVAGWYQTEFTARGPTAVLPTLPGPPGVSTEGGFSLPLSALGRGLAYSTTVYSGPKLFGKIKVDVEDSDVSGVDLEVRRGTRLRLRFVTDGKMPVPSQLGVSLEPISDAIEPQGRFVKVDSDGMAEIDGVIPGSYVVRVQALTKAMKADGRDFLGRPINLSSSTELVVELATALATISGIVVDERGAPASSARVVLFPADTTLWTGFGLMPTLTFASEVTSAGQFTVSGLAGDYYAVAVPSGYAAWIDPQFWRAARPTAVRVTLALGTNQSISLKIVGANKH